MTFAQNDARGLQASGSFTANGMSRLQNNYLLDGMDNNVSIGDLVNQAQYVSMPPPDALREFTVQTSNYSAEFGHSAGAVLNVSTKSGTNRIHGDLWEYLRNDVFDARDYFAKVGVQKKPKYRQNQFGGTVGGPIWKNHAFFFADYQGTRIIQGTTYLVSVPTVAERNSNFTDLRDLITLQGASGVNTDNLGRSFSTGTVMDPATSRSTAIGQIDPVTGLVATASGAVRDPFYTGSIAGKLNYTDAISQGLLNQIPANRYYSKAVDLLKLIPAPNSNGSALTSNYSVSPNIVNKTDAADGRLDYTITQRDSIFFRYSYSYNAQTNPGPFPGVIDGAPNRPGTGYTEAQNGALGWTHVLSAHLVNEARVGYSRVFDKRLQAGATTLGIPDQYGIPGIPQIYGNGGLPHIAFGQLDTIGAGTFLPSDKASNVWQVTENLSIDRSKHQIRAGFEYQNVAFPEGTPSNSRGTFTFNGIFTSIVNKTDASTDRAQFLLEPTLNSNSAAGTYTKYDYVGGANTIAATNYPPNSYPVRRYFGGYVQDAWRATNNLTINAGIRYEFIGVPAERYDHLANFVSSYTGDSSDGISRYYVPRSQIASLTTGVTSVLAANNIVVTPVNDNAIGIAQKDNFAPRLGIAFQPTSKTSIRGGYGIFYSPNLDHGISSTPFANFPYQVTNSYTSGSAFQSIATATADQVGPISEGLSNVALDPSIVKGTTITFNGEPRYPKTGYSQAFSLQVQYQPFHSTVFFVGYVGANSTHIQTTLPTNGVNTINSNNTNINTVSFFHAAGNVMTTGGTYLSHSGASNYNSLQFGAERRFLNGLAFTANMTYSKCLGTTREQLDAGVGGYRAPYVPGLGIAIDYAPCAIDVRRIIHTSGTYELPFGRGKHMLNHGVSAFIAGGWSANWIFTAQDGQPQTVNCFVKSPPGLGCFALKTGAPLYTTSNRVQHFYNIQGLIDPVPATTPATATAAALGGAPGQVFGPEFRRLDLSILRRFNFIHETYFEFRAETFNVTNTPNFAQPGSLSLNNATSFGQISSTRDNPNDPRELQFSLKYYF
ncbi:MAG: TonB-dependent receptor [Acidobacteriaceae bacterium]